MIAHTFISSTNKTVSKRIGFEFFLSLGFYKLELGIDNLELELIFATRDWNRFFGIDWNWN